MTGQNRKFVFFFFLIRSTHLSTCVLQGDRLSTLLFMIYRTSTFCKRHEKLCSFRYTPSCVFEIFRRWSLMIGSTRLWKRTTTNSHRVIISNKFDCRRVIMCIRVMDIILATLQRDQILRVRREGEQELALCSFLVLNVGCAPRSVT